jgi:hypothetical protein
LYFQGPFIITSGASFGVTFRNIFSSPVKYAFSVSDSESFHLPTSNEEIQPHKDTRIMVGFNQPPATVVSKAPFLGKLVVSCSKPYTVPHAAKYQWIFYLRGVASDAKE